MNRAPVVFEALDPAGCAFAGVDSGDCAPCEAHLSHDDGTRHPDLAVVGVNDAGNPCLQVYRGPAITACDDELDAVEPFVALEFDSVHDAAWALTGLLPELRPDPRYHFPLRHPTTNVLRDLFAAGFRPVSWGESRVDTDGSIELTSRVQVLVTADAFRVAEKNADGAVTLSPERRTLAALISDVRFALAK